MSLAINRMLAAQTSLADACHSLVGPEPCAPAKKNATQRELSGTGPKATLVNRQSRFRLLLGCFGRFSGSILGRIGSFVSRGRGRVGSGRSSCAGDGSGGRGRGGINGSRRRRRCGRGCIVGRRRSRIHRRRGGGRGRGGRRAHTSVVRLLAASGQGGGSNQGSHQERLIHTYPQKGSKGVEQLPGIVGTPPNGRSPTDSDMKCSSIFIA